MEHKYDCEWLYKNDKLFRNLFNLMFNKWGWDATEIEKDCLTLYKLINKHK